MSDVTTRFDRLPATAAERDDKSTGGDERQPTREEVLDWWEGRFGIEPAVFEGYTFWERGSGKIWVFHGDLETPVDIEGLGMTALRARQEHWKPTLEAAQRFGDQATRNVIHLAEDDARAFMTGEDREIDWDGDWGYLLVTHDLAGEVEPIGVGLYVHGELQSMVPKGRRRDLR